MVGIEGAEPDAQAICVAGGPLKGVVDEVRPAVGHQHLPATRSAGENCRGRRQLFDDRGTERSNDDFRDRSAAISKAHVHRNGVIIVDALPGPHCGRGVHLATYDRPKGRPDAGEPREAERGGRG